MDDAGIREAQAGGRSYQSLEMWDWCLYLPVVVESCQKQWSDWASDLWRILPHKLLQ